MTEPDELPAEARAWIEDYVHVHAMPRASFERVGRSITKRSNERTAWIVAAVLVAAALVIAIGSSLFTRREVVADGTDPRELAQDRAKVADTDRAIERAPEPTPAELPTIAPAPPSPIATPPAAPPRTKPNAPTIATPPSVDTLTAERELLQTAWDALAAGDGARVKAIAKRHRTEFPRGQLGDVREAIETLARCAAAPATNRPAILAAFERAHPKSIVLDRVREGCGPE